MTKEVDYSTGVVVTSDWLDAMQEIQSGAVINMRLDINGAKVRAVASTGKDQIGIVINGKLRYMASTVETGTIAGAANTYNIFATADTADRDFALVATTLAAPAGITNYRKVGEAVWSGAAITSLKSLASPAPTNDPTFTGTVTIPTPASDSDAKVAATTEWVRDYVASLNVWTPGDIKLIGGTTAPTGWLLCDGSLVSRATYADLFAVIGTTHGVGDGSTTFGLPDLRGRTAVGADNMDNAVGTGGGDAGRLDWANTIGTAGGAQYVALALANMPSHRHVVDSHDHSSTGYTGYEGANVSASTSTGTKAGTLVANASHFHGAITETDSEWGTTQSGTGVNRALASHSHSVTTEGPLGGADVDLSHTHTVTISQTDHRHTIDAEAPNTSIKGGDGVTVDGAGTNHNNMQPSLILNYCIKT